MTAASTAVTQLQQQQSTSSWFLSILFDSKLWARMCMINPDGEHDNFCNFKLCNSINCTHLLDTVVHLQCIDIVALNF